MSEGQSRGGQEFKKAFVQSGPDVGRIKDENFARDIANEIVRRDEAVVEAGLPKLQNNHEQQDKLVKRAIIDKEVESSSRKMLSNIAADAEDPESALFTPTAEDDAEEVAKVRDSANQTAHAYDRLVQAAQIEKQAREQQQNAAREAIENADDGGSE